MMRAVLDTNVLVKRFLSPAGLGARILAHLQAGRYELVTSAEIVLEYRDTLAQPALMARHRFTLAQIEEALFPFVDAQVPVGPIDPVCRDPDDDKFLACALAGGADYIVSGDGDLPAIGIYKGVRIISPTAFLTLLEAMAEAERDVDVEEAGPQD